MDGLILRVLSEWTFNLLTFFFMIFVTNSSNTVSINRSKGNKFLKVLIDGDEL